MSESNEVTGSTQPLTSKQNLENMEHVRDLFARAHDYIAQASHPGHLAPKLAEVMNFLAFHYNDFKGRCEREAVKIEAEAKAELSKVDVELAKATCDAILAPETAQESPKA